MTSPKLRILRWTLPLVFLIVLFVARPLWLRALGEFLVKPQQPFKADIIVELGGDDRGNRILTATRLVREGYAPRILISGPPCCYGRHESDDAAEFAIKHGAASGWLVPFPIQGDSTVEEAREIVAGLNRLHVGRFIIVTSNYHTRRAGNIYARLVPRDRFRVVAAPDWAFRPEDWWRSRAGRKQCCLEWLKTLANWAGL